MIKTVDIKHSRDFPQVHGPITWQWCPLIKIWENSQKSEMYLHQITVQAQLFPMMKHQAYFI